MCGEVRGLGHALLSALEKGDAEHLALVRQRHEIQIQQMAQEVRFLQWKQAQEATTVAAHQPQAGAGALPLLPAAARPAGGIRTRPTRSALDRRELTEENFDEAYARSSGSTTRRHAAEPPGLKRAGESSPGNLSGGSGRGKLYLTRTRIRNSTSHLPTPRAPCWPASSLQRSARADADPGPNMRPALLGDGRLSRRSQGRRLSLATVSKLAATLLRHHRGLGAETKPAWRLEPRLRAAGRRLDAAIQPRRARADADRPPDPHLADRRADRPPRVPEIQQQIENAQEVDQFLHDKFTNEELYLWMQGEISRLYYEYYRFAFDTARKAERTMKQELMRPELDGQDFVKFNYWDGGRKGLLSGEALYLDVKRMEMAYHDNNKREFELTRHVSLRQLDPLALLTLKATGTCQVTIPEWLFDLDCPGHYMRRHQERRPLHSVGRRAVHQRQLHPVAAEEQRAQIAHRQTATTRARAQRTTASSTTSARSSPLSPAAGRTTAACSRPTCATSGSCRSKAPAR